MVLDMKSFLPLLKKDFPQYGFELDKQGAGWCRIFITYDGVSIGRLNFQPAKNVRNAHTYYGSKCYGAGDYPYTDGQAIFTQIDFWIRHGVILTFADLIPKAKRLERDHFYRVMKWREENPKKKGGRPRIQRNWSNYFHRLVYERIQEEEKKYDTEI